MAESRTIKVDDPVYRQEVCVLHGMIAAKEAIETAGVVLAGAALARLAVEKAIADQRLMLHQVVSRCLFKAGVPIDRVVSIAFRGDDKVDLRIDEEDLFNRATPASAKREPDLISPCPDPPAPER